MARIPRKASSSKGKGLVGRSSKRRGAKQLSRVSYNMEQKIFAINHKNNGKPYSEIHPLYKDRYGVLVPSSTLSSWYSDEGKKKVLDLCVNFKVNQVTKDATRVNNAQRPHIMLYTEYFL